MTTLTGRPGGDKRPAVVTVFGYLFLAILAVSVVAGLVLVLFFLSDIRRYLTIRRM